MFGIYDIGIVDKKYQRSMWHLEGKLIIRGKTEFGAGTRLSVDEGATLDLGCNFIISGFSTIIVNKMVKFGNDCKLSWGIMVMDTDYHDIVDYEGNKLNDSKPIIFGNHVWIGCNSTILKGVRLGNDVIIAADTLVTRNQQLDRCILGNSRSQLVTLKDKVIWIR